MKKMLFILLISIYLIGIVSAVGYLEFVEYPKCENNVVRFSMKNVGDERVDIRDNPVMIIRPEIYESSGIFSKYIINPGQTTEFTSAPGDFPQATTYSLEVPEDDEGSIPNVRVICHTSEEGIQGITDEGGNTFQCIDGNWKKLSIKPYCNEENENLYIDQSGNEHSQPSTYSSVNDKTWCSKKEVTPGVTGQATQDSQDNSNKNSLVIFLGILAVLITIIICLTILSLKKRK